MKYNYAAIKDLYQAQATSPNKGPGKAFCLNCHKTIDEKQFFKSGRLDKFPEGRLPHCKTCCTMGVQDNDPTTFLAILKEIDVPFIPSEWRGLLVKKPRGSASILGKYVSKMRLYQWKKYRWSDSDRLTAEETESILAALRQESDTETEAEDKLDTILSMSDISQPQSAAMTTATDISALYGLTEETSKYSLSEKEISSLKLEWGADYKEDEYLQLEQLFSDMKASYIIQDPIALSNAKMICKMTMKMNKFLDIDDIESVSKLSRQLDLFIKTANLAPVQQKDRQSTTFAISQLAFLVEREGGFIPEFYIEQPNDCIDMLLRDMQEYTEHLVRGESNISEMLANTESILAQDALPDAVEDYDDFAALEAELLGEINNIGVEEEDGSSVTTD